jgi:hypothetical protein
VCLFVCLLNDIQVPVQTVADINSWTARERTKESVKNNKFILALDSRKMVLIDWV